MLARPQGFRLDDRGWESGHSGKLVVGDQLTKSSIDKLHVIILCQIAVLRAQEHTGHDTVLDETSDRFTGCGHDILLVCGHKLVGFGSRLVGLRQMDVHLVTVEVSVVGAAVGVVHADRLLFGQNLRKMRHHTRLMQRGLSVDQQDITIA